MKYDPKTYQREGSLKDKEYQGFGKFFFVPQSCPSSQKDRRFPKDKKIIYIDQGECPTVVEEKNVHTIFKEDGAIAFKVQYVTH